MSQLFIQSIKEGLSQAATNPEAKFQTVQRYKRFPGANLHYVFTLIPSIPPSSSDKSVPGIAKIIKENRHSDILNEIDSEGNFSRDNYVTSSRKYYDTLVKKFAKAKVKGSTLTIIDPESFLNKRLRAAVSSS